MEWSFYSQHPYGHVTYIYLSSTYGVFNSNEWSSAFIVEMKQLLIMLIISGATHLLKHYT